mmetsp:Transcript_95073/g.255727  ORF Transcript_95073/g.255727 Transcript_95073/m.255727 type:complete len:202 (-) Transcript_95073:7-612(-)
MPLSTPPSSWRRAWVPWCLDSTTIALRRLVTACTMSFSSSRNSPASFSRISVAFASVSVFSWISFFVCSIVAASWPNFAERSSVPELSCKSLASASAIAFVFSFSFVSHQQTILSYISDSLPASASNSAFIFSKRLTTRLTGLTFWPSNSLPQAASREACLELDSSSAARPPVAASPRKRTATLLKRAIAENGLDGGFGLQ